MREKNPMAKANTFEICKEVKTVKIRPGDERANFNIDANIYVKVIKGKKITSPFLMTELAVYAHVTPL